MHECDVVTLEIASQEKLPLNRVHVLVKYLKTKEQS